MPLRLVALVVAPHWGAWIEISPPNHANTAATSHPTGVRGLKLAQLVTQMDNVDVAPHWGAWIEIPALLALSAAA